MAIKYKTRHKKQTLSSFIKHLEEILEDPRINEAKAYNRKKPIDPQYIKALEYQAKQTLVFLGKKHPGLTAEPVPQTLQDILIRFRKIEKPPEIESHNLPPSQEKAYRSYKYAVHQDSKIETDRQAYQWLENYGLPEYELPSFDTWRRHLRAGRNYYGEQKNKPRAGRQGRSTVGKDQIDYKSSQQADRNGF